MQVAGSQRPRDLGSAWRIRAYGVAIGGGVSAAVAAVCVALRLDWPATIASVGIGTGAIIGAWRAPAVAVTTRPLVSALALSVIALPVGAVTWVLVAWISAPSGGAGWSVIAMLGLAVLYSLASSPAMLPIVAPIAIVSVYAGRRVARLRPRSAALAVVALLLADGVAWMGAPHLASALDRDVVDPSGVVLRTEPFWLDAVLADRRVEVSTINRSTRPIEITVMWPAGAGSETGIGSGAPACARTAETYAVGEGWRLRATTIPDMTQGFEVGPGPVLTSAAAFDGDAAVVLDVTADGRITVEAGRLDDEELGLLHGCR
jgi:hypothetical protein